MQSALKTLITAAAIGGIAMITGFAHPGTPRNLTLAKESRLWFDGTSTVKSFSCAATKIDVTVSAEPGSEPGELVRSASFVVPVEAIDCRNGTMNDHMRKALKASDNPQISWKLVSYRVDGANVVMDSRLSIAGKENPMEIRATGTTDATGTIRVKGMKELRMTEFGVKPPSLMLGTMKVGDPVKVSFDLILNP